MLSSDVELIGTDLDVVIKADTSVWLSEISVDPTDENVDVMDFVVHGLGEVLKLDSEVIV